MSTTIIYQNDCAKFNTILDFLRYGITVAQQYQVFYGHGTDNAWDEIWLLISETLNLPFEYNEILLNAKLTTKEQQLIAQRLQQRILKRIPVPYLLKMAYFCNLVFYVDERVLIPRSPIAELIQQQFSPWIDVENVHNILDLCTGSACIAIACCYHFEDITVDAVDISLDALAVAEINCTQHNLNEHINLIQSDCFINIPKKCYYDIIIANPPYVGDAEMLTLPYEYKYEPDLALRAENNGLAIIEQILFAVHEYLTPHGILIMEVGNSQFELSYKYPNIPFTWLNFERGGYGVLLLTYEQLINIMETK